MAKDMVLRNDHSTGKDITIGRNYYAKIDSNGKLRVQDDTGRWSKYSPRMFTVIEDEDNQMALYGTVTKTTKVGDMTEAEATDYVWERILYGKLAVHCATESEATAFLTALSELAPALTWLSGKPLTITKWETYKDDTCYKVSSKSGTRASLSFCDIKYFIEDSIKVVDYSDIAPLIGLHYITTDARTTLDLGEAMGMSVETPTRIASTDDVASIISEFEGLTETMSAPAVTKSSEEKEIKTMKKKTTLREILMGQGVSSKLIDMMNEFRNDMADPNMPEEIKARIPKPTTLYEGGELWTDCITAILSGKPILLSGGKATGKNTLATSLAFAFQRPIWDMSFHSNIGKDEIIGSETFRGGEVVFNPGMAYTCALYGGFGILDEINMAKDSAIAVLNSILDDRRVIDVPGYSRINLHPATTFIGTMNYGYAGTRALNEALASRFVIPDVREMTDKEITQLLIKKFPEANASYIQYFAGTFSDLQTKAKNAEISTASVDLRGIISALAMVRNGRNPNAAMVANVVNKSFEEYERNIVRDVVDSRIPRSWSANEIFPTSTDSKEFSVDMSKC